MTVAEAERGMLFEDAPETWGGKAQLGLHMLYTGPVENHSQGTVGGWPTQQRPAHLAEVEAAADVAGLRAGRALERLVAHGAGDGLGRGALGHCAAALCPCDAGVVLVEEQRCGKGKAQGGREGRSGRLGRLGR